MIQQDKYYCPHFYRWRNKTSEERIDSYRWPGKFFFPLIVFFLQSHLWSAPPSVNLCPTFLMGSIDCVILGWASSWYKKALFLELGSGVWWPQSISLRAKFWKIQWRAFFWCDGSVWWCVLVSWASGSLCSWDTALLNSLNTQGLFWQYTEVISELWLWWFGDTKFYRWQVRLSILHPQAITKTSPRKTPEANWNWDNSANIHGGRNSNNSSKYEECISDWY